MSTVPKAGDPAPPNNAKTLTIGDGSGMYARPTAGGSASGDANVPAGAIPPAPFAGSVKTYPASGPSGFNYNQTSYPTIAPGMPPSTGGTQAGPDFGHGATQIVAQPDATGHPSSDLAGGGTVGDSGPGLGQ